MFRKSPSFSLESCSRKHRSVTDSSGAEDAAVAFDFGWRAECLGVVVGELYRGTAFDIGDLADQADRVEPTTAFRIAATKIIGQQGAPTCADSNARAGNPLSSIQEIGCGSKIRGRRAIRKGPAKISVQGEYLIDVERVGGDDQLFKRIAAVHLQPFDIFVAREIRILAVDALARPVGGPVRRARQELRGSESVRQHYPKRAFIGVLPQCEHAVLRSFQSATIWR